jgi:hypothetical protein
MLDTQRECLAGELSLTLGGAISPILSLETAITG